MYQTVLRPKLKITLRPLPCKGCELFVLQKVFNLKEFSSKNVMKRQIIIIKKALIIDL